MKENEVDITSTTDLFKRGVVRYLDVVTNRVRELSARPTDGGLAVQDGDMVRIEKA